jgi:hypothetical protein
MDSITQSYQLASALVCVEKGWFVFPLGEKSKIPDTEFAPNGFKSASNDIAQIREWWTKKPNANIGIDLGRSNLTVLDFDKGKPPVELNLPETLCANTSRGIHVYLQGVSKQGDMYFNGLHLGEIKSAGGYTLAPFSIHPDGSTYTIAIKAAVAYIPDGLIDRLRPTQKDVVQDETPRDSRGQVPHGQIHNFLLSHAGRLRSIGLSADAIEVSLLEIAHNQCAPPIDESKIKLLANSICNFPPGQVTDLILTQNPQSTQSTVEPEELPTFDENPYPKFPHYVMEGTSIYENFVKPICDLNERVDYLMFLPAMIMLLNYIGPKVEVENFSEKFKGSIYAVLIGRKGKTHKSESVKDAMNYFNYAGALQHFSKDTKAAEGKTVVWTAGSPEGLGVNMQKTNCRNALLFYDELSKLVNKAGVESSALVSDLLTMYESGKFDNSIKSTKESFSLAPDTYCTSLIACTTDKKFSTLWSRLAGSDTGLDDRFFFILQPEELPKPRLKAGVLWQPGAIETKKLLDKAILQQKFSFEDNSPLNKLNEIDPRYANRAEKWALAIAVDLGLDVIDGECVERGVDIVKYEIAVKKYLKSYEATTREGQIQQEIRRQLELAKGQMSRRDLYRKLNADKHGTSLWSSSYGGLIKNGIIREEGGGTRNNPVCVQLLIKRDTDDDE